MENIAHVFRVRDTYYTHTPYARISMSILRFMNTLTNTHIHI